jgi:hypothetical protein
MHSFTPWFHGHRRVTGTWGRAIQQVSPHAAAVTIDRVFAAPNLKAVHMLIVPTESDLQYLVELGHRTIAPHQKPSPNQRADAAQYHPQLINLSFMTISRHTRSPHGAPHTPNFRLLSVSAVNFCEIVASFGALANQLAHRAPPANFLTNAAHVFSSPISAPMDSSIAGCKLHRQRDSSNVESAAATIYVA